MVNEAEFRVLFGANRQKNLANWAKKRSSYPILVVFRRVATKKISKVNGFYVTEVGSEISKFLESHGNKIITPIRWTSRMICHSNRRY